MAADGTVTSFSQYYDMWTACDRYGINGHIHMELFSPHGFVRLEVQHLLFNSLSYSVATSFEGIQSDMNSLFAKTAEKTEGQTHTYRYIRSTNMYKIRYKTVGLAIYIIFINNIRSRTIILAKHIIITKII